MIITVQGYNGKKNKSIMAASSIAGMMSMYKSSRTLVLQLINKDIDTVEGIMIGQVKQTNTFGGENTFIEQGIDSMLRIADTTRMTKSEFDMQVTPMLRMENLLDVTINSKSNDFIASFGQGETGKEKALLNILDGAREVYDNVIVLLPSTNPSFTKMVNEKADQSVYCIRQGYHLKGEVYGKQIVYLVTDYEPESNFTLKTMKKEFCQHRSDKMFKLTKNIGCCDALMTGQLLNFMRKNRKLTETDINHQWAEDLRALADYLTDDEKTDTSEKDWETPELFLEQKLDMEKKQRKRSREKEPIETKVITSAPTLNKAQQLPIEELCTKHNKHPNRK